ncbi:MAG: MgtC/SapB family protein [Oscillibacter sp.]|nr:MgtC/SapB family protein [Oscillibacter sp.]
MFPVLAYLREFHFLSAVLRLLLAMAAGGAVGYGRTRKRRSAGMRTYMLTSLGAALTILIAMYEREMLYGQWAWASEFTDIKFDASRFSSQVINGVGFLAAGTIIGVDHQQVSGLTTAIGLFCSAAMGIAAGAGFYECVLIGVPILVCAIELMRPLETRYKRRLRNITLAVEFDAIDSIPRIRELIAAHGAQVFELDVERTVKEGGKNPSAILSVKLAREAASHSAMLSALAELPCVYGVRELIS